MRLHKIINLTDYKLIVDRNIGRIGAVLKRHMPYIYNKIRKVSQNKSIEMYNN